jgi:hypothetical protein
LFASFYADLNSIPHGGYSTRARLRAIRPCVLDGGS